jgi:hypothetical protein
MSPTAASTASPVRSVPLLGTVLTAWAHPDDETYLSGGPAWRAARRRPPSA